MYAYREIIASDVHTHTVFNLAVTKFTLFGLYFIIVVFVLSLCQGRQKPTVRILLKL